jgi:hypothetical protein
VSYLHVQRIEINDLVFFFKNQRRNMTWDEVISLIFIESFFDKKVMWHEMIFLNF